MRFYIVRNSIGLVSRAVCNAGSMEGTDAISPVGQL